MQDLIKEYYQLRKEIDDRVRVLEAEHKTHLMCRKGCDSCCESINVFPIEFYAIRSELEQQNSILPFRRFNSLRKSCMFLKDSACTIYSSRPIICRTQGMPLMYQSLSGEGYEISHCELNFKSIDLSSFTIDNSMFMPDYNSRLFLLNQRFIEQLESRKYDVKKRLPLYKLSQSKDI